MNLLDSLGRGGLEKVAVPLDGNFVIRSVRRCTALSGLLLCVVTKESIEESNAAKLSSLAVSHLSARPTKPPNSTRVTTPRCPERP